MIAEIANSTRRSSYGSVLTRVASAAALVAFAGALPLTAQEGSSEGDDTAERARVQAVVDAALAAISDEDLVGFTDLMIDEAVVYPVVQEDGAVRYASSTRAEQRERTFEQDLVERGFDAEIRVSGPIAMAWVPYDFYIDGEWSHCGVDIFTLVLDDDEWRISSITWSVEQPPACRPHPNGPPQP